jgi:hypothetical protein
MGLGVGGHGDRGAWSWVWVSCWEGFGLLGMGGSSVERGVQGGSLERQ